jgi:molybdate transport repressor ModE-like protein
MTAPDVESLRLLVLIGDLGSIGRAARELGLAQPSASNRLSVLERRLGLVLVDRSRRGSALTGDGQAVAVWARRVLQELDGLLTGAEALRTHRAAELRIAASMTLAEYLVPAWIGELRRVLPQLYVGLQVTNSERVTELVRGEDVDLGFVESPGVPRDLASRRVATDRLVVVVPPAHPWSRRRRALTAAELAATPMIVRERGSGTRETVDTALRRAGAGGGTALLELGSAAAIRNAVIGGAGPAVISQLAVADDLDAGRLVRVAVEGVDFTRVLRAVWPRDRRLAGPAATLLGLASARHGEDVRRGRDGADGS